MTVDVTGEADVVVVEEGRSRRILVELADHNFPHAKEDVHRFIVKAVAEGVFRGGLWLVCILLAFQLIWVLARFS